MQYRVGTSGYSYKEWKGPFYPEDLPAKEMLRFYAEHLPAVEINNTFYRMPTTSVLETWAATVPEDFRFALKASRRITHFKRLKDAGDETGYLLRAAESLGERLGVLLFQLPPNLKCDLPRLEAFLALLPEGSRAVFEFRHPSWQDEPVHARLRERGFGLVCVDADDAEPPALVATARTGYLRLRRPGYARAELAAWARRIAAVDWDEVYVFFKHEDAGAGPKLAAEFLDLSERARERRPAAAAARRAEPRKTG